MEVRERDSGEVTGNRWEIPTIGPPDGVGWRLRPRGHGRRLDDHDPRGKEAGGARHASPLLAGSPDGVHAYVELHCHTCYSFREGASTPRELVSRGAALGYEALAITDRDGLYGAMEFAKAAQAVRPIIGADVTLQGGYRLVLLAETREGYANLCQLISHAHLAEALPPNPQISLAALAQHTRGLIALSGDEHGEVPALVAAGRFDRAVAAARRYATWFGPESFFIELQQTLTFGDTQRNRRLVELARQLGLGVVATNDVWYHVRERHRLHDVLVAIRHQTTLDGSHRLRHANSERYLKSAEEMAELFEEVPEALQNTVAIAERCRFDLVRDLGYEFPHAEVPPDETPEGYLGRICREALRRKYSGVDPSSWAEAEARLEEELALIKKHGLAGFFLAYYHLLKLAGGIASELKGRDPTLPPDERPVGRGRGSSVSSIVCYLIGLSHIDPVAHELFLGRFLNDELPSVPDIDLDFPRDIRDELLKRIWAEFDEGRAALVCAYSTYHGRSAVRDVGKALGLPALEIDHLAKLVDSWGSLDIAHEMEHLPEYRSKVNAPLWRDLVALSQEIMGLPRHVTQHVGGVVLSAWPLQELVPLEPTRMEGRVMCQWDKDSVDDARMVKIDFLALGMLSLVDECLEMLERRSGKRPDLGRIPHDDPEVYDRICTGDTIGLFQIESRAQIATLARTQPRNLDDLAVQVAIVRPGPIVSGAFRPFMEYRRRLREGEPVNVAYIHPCLEPVLKDTLGVVLYQEQVVQVAMAIAGYTAGEADRLRRNLNRRRGAELAGEDWPLFLERARARGIPDEAAKAAFKAILGFAAYGFPKSHAVAFGLLAYESAWLRYHYPAEYCASLFNNQPMGFYSSEVIAGDARRHGIEIARPDINLSAVGCVAETDRRVRLGLAEVKGIGRGRLGRSPVGEAIVGEREAHGPFLSLVDCADRTGLRAEALENLIMAGAFDGLEHPQPSALVGRRDLLWQLGLIRGRPSSLSLPHKGGGEDSGSGRQGGGPRAEDSALPVRWTQRALPLPIEQDMVALPPMSGWEEVAAEYEVLGLSPETHAMAMLRRALSPSLTLSASPPKAPTGRGSESAKRTGKALQGGGEDCHPSPREGSVSTRGLVDLPDGAEVQVAGLVVCRQRPSTAKGVVFLSVEDEYGLANVVVYPPLFDRQRTLILTEPFLIVRGRVQRQGTVVHVVARQLERPDVHTDRLIRASHDFR